MDGCSLVAASVGRTVQCDECPGCVRESGGWQPEPSLGIREWSGWDGREGFPSLVRPTPPPPPRWPNLRLVAAVIAVAAALRIGDSLLLVLLLLLLMLLLLLHTTPSFGGLLAPSGYDSSPERFKEPPTESPILSLTLRA